MKLTLMFAEGFVIRHFFDDLRDPLPEFSRNYLTWNLLIFDGIMQQSCNY